MTGHTKAPWEIIGEDEACPGVPIIEIAAGEMGTRDHKEIAHVQPTLDEDGDFVLTDEDYANAHLIAAADDMLAALKAFVDTLDAEEMGEGPPAAQHAAHWQELHNTAVAVIIKAEGQYVE